MLDSQPSTSVPETIQFQALAFNSTTHHDTSQSVTRLGHTFVQALLL